jgi:hypothetical protein
VLLLVHGIHITVIHATTGEVLRELTLDTTRPYQPQTAKNPEPCLADVLRHHIVELRGFEPLTFSFAKASLAAASPAPVLGRHPAECTPSRV